MSKPVPPLEPNGEANPAVIPPLNSAAAALAEMVEEGDGTNVSVPSRQPIPSSISASPFDQPLPTFQLPPSDPNRSYSPIDRPPTSAEIDAVIAAAIANAPPAPPQQEIDRSNTPLMTNLLPSAVGADGRVNLFVGNLPYRVRWQDLKDLFRKAGTVLRADVSLGPDNRSRGYGTVLMGSREDAARAIDRFNGFTWQTRTLEVRPDRLPPEYEPQPHPIHHARPPMYNYPNSHPQHGVGQPPFSMPGHLGHAPWLPIQIGRPQHPGSHTLQHHFSLASHGMPPMNVTGPSPMPEFNAAGSSYGSPTQGSVSSFQPIGASPLAGSLTSGPTGQLPTVSVNATRRDSISPFAHTIRTENAVSAGQSTSSSVQGSGSPSRPQSSAEQHVASSSQQAEANTARSGPPGKLGPLPPSSFAGVKAVVPSLGVGEKVSTATPPSEKPVGPGHGPPVAIAMEGLSHQGAHMGPPSTLHDRVVFVSNLPLNMQWQEVKDLLRPAGLIIRADVATDSEGHPRGFGTALFATEQDAAKAVGMFNEREISGKRIRVSLERDIITESLSRRGSAALSALGLQDSNPQHDPLESPTETIHPSGEASAPSRVPWALNTGNNGFDNPSRQDSNGQDPSSTPQHSYRHHPPGPISMPSFGPLDTTGNPSSPLQRGLPPMTPSMPGFVFNAYPETPPVHPPFMSPGFGPFSPGLPVTSPTGFQYNPFLNAAPGAPVNRFPQGGSAALGTPTTQSFPSNPVHGYFGGAGAIGAPGAGHQPSIGQVGDYFPAMGNGFNGYNGQSQGGDQSPASNRLSQSTRGITPSPLNAKDRLASTSSSEAGTTVSSSTLVNDLADKTGSLSLTAFDGAASVPGTGPPSPTKNSKMSNGPDLSSVSKYHMNTRASIDMSGPKTLGVWDKNNERRASFGDIVAGRTKE